jgi:hypothetical protein
LTDTNLRVCGGDLQKLGADFYLIFGHSFMGRYSNPPSPLFTQVYTNEIKKFNIINNNGSSVNIANYSVQTDTNNFHRRDLNVVPIIQPNYNEALMAHAGVFQKNKDFPYFEPITISQSGNTVHAYLQQMSQYTCAHIPIFDSTTKTMYTTFLGGISFNDYNPSNGTITQDTLSPFVNDVTTFTTYQNGAMEEAILPLQLPGLLGSNAKFILPANVPQYNNGVIKLHQLTSPLLIGYMLGGIRSDTPNLPAGSVANDTVYRVLLTPNPVSISENKMGIEFFNVYPNPVNENESITVSLKTNGLICGRTNCKYHKKKESSVIPNNNNLCTSILKSGPKKGQECGRSNCKYHHINL